MVNGRFINLKRYNFTNKQTGEQIIGQNCNVLVDDEICKVSLTDEQYDYVADNFDFGKEIQLDVVVKGKFAKYVLA